MSANDLFKQNTNKFLHGVRGIVVVDGEVEGAVQDVTATESGEEDLARVMGSRYIQGKELKNKVVNGTISTLLFDPVSQNVMKFTDPVDTIVGEAPNREDLDTPKSYESTLVSDLISGANIESGRSDLSIVPIFDLECKAKVIDTDGTVKYNGFSIKGCMITEYEIMFNRDTWWIGNITFVADKIVRENNFE